MGKSPVAEQDTILPVAGLQPPLTSIVILDFNRKSSDFIESVSSLFVGVIRTPLLEDPFLKSCFSNFILQRDISNGNH